MSLICIKAVVSGKVQGVFFRDATVKKAKALGLTGTVKNTVDGRVEVEACGDEKAADELTEWLWEGSPASEVSDVEVTVIPFKTYDNFIVIR